jgi:hypothetical protein
MSFQGMIEDVSVVDVMQLIRVGGHSGSLTVSNGEEQAIVGFERGRIVSAWNPGTLRVGELLVAAGAIDETMLAAALAAQNNDRPRRPVGHYLVKLGATTPEIIRQVMAQEIERVVAEMCTWKTGSFEFAVDDLTPVVEVTRFTGAPKLDLDTQTVLMEALRRMQEGGAMVGEGLAGINQQPLAEGEPWPAPDDVAGEEGAVPDEAMARQPAGESSEFEAVTPHSATRGNARIPAGLAADGASDVPAEPRDPGPAARHSPVHELGPRAAASPEPAARVRFQLVSPDNELCADLNALLAATGDHISAVALRDAGASLLGESPPIVVVDLRYQPTALATLAALCRSRPRAGVIALFEGRAPLREMYKVGVLSVTSAVPATVVACMQSVARQRKYMSNEVAVIEGIRTSFARLRRIIADLRSGLLGTSVSSNLMAAVAESLERGVLFVPHLDRLVAVGAFGNTLAGDPLTHTTKGLVVPVGDGGVFKTCLADSRPRRMSYAEANLPAVFVEAVDRPRTGEIAVLPVPGSERIIAAVYMDNGGRDRPIGDIEIFELAAFQLGLALENEFLRRSKPMPEVLGAIIGERKTG